MISACTIIAVCTYSIADVTSVLCSVKRQHSGLKKRRRRSPPIAMRPRADSKDALTRTESDQVVFEYVIIMAEDAGEQAAWLENLLRKDGLTVRRVGTRYLKVTANAHEVAEWCPSARVDVVTGTVACRWVSQPKYSSSARKILKDSSPTFDLTTARSTR